MIQRNKDTPHIYRYKSWRRKGLSHEEAHDLAKAGITITDVTIADQKAKKEKNSKK